MKSEPVSKQCQFATNERNLIATVEVSKRWRHYEAGPSPERVKLIGQIADLAQQCADAAETMKEQQRLSRVEAISQWCVDVAQQIAEGTLPTDVDPDYMTDVASVAWELTALSEGKWPPPMVIQLARRKVAGGYQFETSTVTIESESSPFKRVDFDTIDLDRFREGTNPAWIAEFRIDLDWFMDGLPDRPKDIARMFANGKTGQQVVDQLQVSERYVNRVRQWMRDRWETYFAES